MNTPGWWRVVKELNDFLRPYRSPQENDYADEYLAQGESGLACRVGIVFAYDHHLPISADLLEKVVAEAETDGSLSGIENKANELKRRTGITVRELVAA